jgi:hypothetical protein
MTDVTTCQLPRQTTSKLEALATAAAGGIKDSNGFSNVICAGTDGLGPLLPTGGHLWVTPNASVGPASWLDRTGGINPGGFPVSAPADRYSSIRQRMGAYRADRIFIRLFQQLSKSLILNVA